MIRFSFHNILGSAVSSSGDTANLSISQPSKLWYSTDTYSNTHTLDFSFERGIVSCLGLFNLTLLSTANVIITLKDGLETVKEFNLTAGQIIYGYGEGPYGLFAYGGYSAPGRDWLNRFRVLWFEDIYADSMHISFEGSNTVSLGYVHLGPSWSPPVGITESYYSTFKLIGTEMSRTIGGSSTGSLSRTYREIAVELQLMTADDVDYIFGAIENYKPIVFGAYAQKTDTESLYGTLLCKAPSGLQVSGSIKKRFSAVSLTLEELK